MTVLLVALGGAVGASARFLLDRWVQRHSTGFPLGTLAANVLGSLLLGALVGTSWPVFPLLGTGFCGALTTFSTFGYETVRLFAERARLLAVLNVLGTAAAGLAAAALGMLLTGA
ncbi:fluoride efflux transporter CrcB [Saccharopolyspora cebuensis]|uniref:Fluoride-specific ion channel FluC n=1 Tax=Saccharopolyspora cebuensis TaxID=418759 RepID=A0ABV4CS43_9PSEU